MLMLACVMQVLWLYLANNASTGCRTVSDNMVACLITASLFVPRQLD
jgi:hypothetical protein